MILGLDFETYSDVDLKVHGTDRYVTSLHFRVLLACVQALPENLAYPGDLKLADDGHPAFSPKTPNEILEQGKAIDFTDGYDTALNNLKHVLSKASLVIVHNASFEIAVLNQLGIGLPPIVDTASMARRAGGSSSLKMATRQFCPDKVKDSDAGDRLIPIFCIGEGAFDESLPVREHADWQSFKHYGMQDVRSMLALYVALTTGKTTLPFEEVTRSMNTVGWPVDMELVHAMQDRYEELKAEALTEFRGIYDPKETLNFNSPKQIVAWAAVRGVKLRSTDEAAVEKALARLEAKLKQLREGPVPASFSAAAHEHTKKVFNYEAVQGMLQTKQLLGGASLKKLQKIIDTVGVDGRLRNQYLFAGAIQTERTTGVGVQMQNLKRFSGEPLDVADVASWTIDELQDNLRQVFAPKDPEGLLIVGDFSSVEARGLVWVAGENWALDAYWKGEDLYKLTAASIFNTPVEHIDKGQRQVGKVAVLSCGYGASSVTVKDMAAGMGLTLSTAEASKIVYGWRDANPHVVELWSKLEAAFREAVLGASNWIHFESGASIIFEQVPAPVSVPKGVSIRMKFTAGMGRITFSRLFHGVYLHGTEIRYHKPTNTKTGKLWSDVFKNPKTKRWEHYKLYGGKLTGILIQSLCREIFAESAAKLRSHLPSEFLLIGQFHDELVVEQPHAVQPGQTAYAKELMEKIMSTCSVPSFPLAAEIKSAYRYTK